MRSFLFLVLFISLVEVKAQSLFTGVYGNNANNLVCKLAPVNEFVYAVGLNGNITKLTNSGTPFYAVRTDSLFNYYDFVVSSNNSLLVVGLTYVGTEKQTLITKLDSVGNVIWNKVYEGDNRQMQQQIVQPVAGVDEFIVSNWHLKSGADDDLVVFKINGDGSIIWKYKYDYGDDQLDGITLDNEGGVLITGAATNPFGYTGSVLHLDGDGDIIAAYRIGTSLYALHKITQALDGGYLIVGDNLDVGNNRNPIIIKLNNLMEIEWSKSIKAGTLLGTYPITGAGGVTQDSEHNIYTTSIVYFGGENRQVLSKYSPEGDLISQKSFGKTANTEPFIIQIASKLDGIHDIIFASNTKDDLDTPFGLRDMQLLAIDTSLTSCYLDPVSLDYEDIDLSMGDAFFEKSIMTLNVYEIEGEVINYFFQPITCDTIDVPSGINEACSYDENTLIVSPNPATNVFKLTNLPMNAQQYILSIYNLQGSLVASFPVVNNWGVIEIKDLDLKSGEFILKLSNKQFEETTILVIN